MNGEKLLFTFLGLVFLTMVILRWQNERYGRPDGELNGKAKKERPVARFAPQFDGLHCYETLVRH